MWILEGLRDGVQRSYWPRKEARNQDPWVDHPECHVLRRNQLWLSLGPSLPPRGQTLPTWSRRRTLGSQRPTKPVDILCLSLPDLQTTQPSQTSQWNVTVPRRLDCEACKKKATDHLSLEASIRSNRAAYLFTCVVGQYLVWNCKILQDTREMPLAFNANLNIWRYLAYSIRFYSRPNPELSLL